MKKKNKIRYPILRVVFGFVLLFSLWIGFSPKENTIQNVLDNPENFDGGIYQIGGKIIKEDSRFVYTVDTETNHIIKILKDSRFIDIDRQFDSITVYGFLNGAEGYFVPIKLRIHKFIILKDIASIIGLFIFLFIFFREWKITKTGFQCRE